MLAPLLVLAPRSDEPELFAPSVISTADDELNAAFTPDQATIYFSKSVPNNRMGVIMVSHSSRGRWSAPEIASFSGHYSDYDPFITPDGAHLFFISNRPRPGSPATPQRTFDIWVVDKNGTEWSAPRSFGPPINTDAQEFYPSVAANGTLYFSSSRPGGKGAGDIYRSRLVDGQYTEPESLGDSINTAAHEGDPFIAPDESYLIFASYGRSDDLGTSGAGSGDLYLSRNVAGTWTKPRHLDAPLNSPAREYCPIVSPDGRFFYFSSYRGFADTLPIAPANAAALATQAHGIRNGLGNIYRVPVSALP